MPESGANSLLSSELKELVDRILPYQGEDGSFLRSDVHTYHFIQALEAINRVAFKPHIDKALDWFERLEDPRDQNPRSVSPFRLQALAGTDRAVEFQDSAKSKILDFMVGSEGNINLPLGMVEASDAYDLFPTLAATSILIQLEETPVGTVEDALRWSVGKLPDVRRLSNIGFLALTMALASRSGISLDQASVQLVLEKLQNQISQEEAVEDSLQASYLVYDLAIVAATFGPLGQPDIAVDLALQLAKRRSEESEAFYKGQDAALLDLRLIVAYSSILTDQERESFVEQLLASAFSEKVLLARRYKELEGQAQRLAVEVRRRQMEDEGQGLFIAPHWPIRGANQGDKEFVFFLMPFSNDHSPPKIKALNSLFQNEIRADIDSNFGLAARRADDIFDTRPVMMSVWDSILEARVVVADLTGKNPNVFYETGIADTLGKDLILLSQDIDDVPFDLRARRVILYSVDYPGPDNLRKALIQTLRNVLEG